MIKNCFLFLVLTINILPLNQAICAENKTKEENQTEVFFLLSFKDIVLQGKRESNLNNGCKIWIDEVIDKRPEGRRISEGSPVIIVKESLIDVVKEIIAQGFKNNGFEIYIPEYKESESNEMRDQIKNIIKFDCEIRSFWTKTFIENKTVGKHNYFTYVEVAFCLIQKEIKTNHKISTYFLIGENKLKGKEQPAKQTYLGLFTAALNDALTDIENFIEDKGINHMQTVTK